MKKNNINEEDFLSKDEQLHFNKYMKEYEEQNNRIQEIYNDENVIMRTLKNKKFLISVIVFFVIASCVSIIHSFVNINENGAPKKEAVIAEQQKAQMNTDAQIQKEKEEQQQLENDNEKNKQANDKELNEIKNNFHPWDENNYQSNTTPQINDMKGNSSAIYKNNTPNNNDDVNNNSYTSSPIPSVPPAPIITSPVPTNTSPTTANNSTDNNSEWMALKGIAIDRNGNYICYIKNGTSTNSYHEGDYIDEYQIININNSFVVVIDKNGNKMNLNK